MQYRRWTKSVILVAAAALAAGLAACSGGVSPQPENSPSGVDPHAPEVQTLRTSVWQGSNSVALWLAKDIAKDGYGLTITSDWATDGAAIRAQLAGGSLDAIPGAAMSVFDMQQQGLDVRIVANSYYQTKGTVTLEVLPTSGISGPADLEGKKIGTIAPSGAYVTRVQTAAFDAGADPSKLEFVVLPYGEMAAALQQGIIDVATTQGLAQSQAREIGSKEIFDLGTGMPGDRPENVWMMMGAFVDANPNTVAAFQCAIAAAAEPANDRANVEKYLLDVVGWPQEIVASSPSVLFTSAPVDVDEIRLDLDDRVRYGDLPEGTEADWKAWIVPAPENC